MSKEYPGVKDSFVHARKVRKNGTFEKHEGKEGKEKDKQC